MVDHANSLWIWADKEECWVCGCGEKHYNPQDKLRFRKYAMVAHAELEAEMETIRSWNRAVDASRPSGPLVADKEGDEREGTEPEMSSQSELYIEGGTGADATQLEGFRENSHRFGDDQSGNPLRDKRRRKGKR